MTLLAPAVFHRGDRIRLTADFWTNQTTLALPAQAGATAITVQNTAGYANTNPVILDPGRDTEETAEVSGSPSGGVITLAAALRYSHTVGSVVGELTNPTSAVIWTKDPTGTETSNATTQDSTGRYHVDVDLPDDPASEGVWHYRPQGTGAVIATDEQRFVCADSAFS